ncbi:MAG: mechanosensitive ion channel [Piscirickettsiaceae bacterium]|nr:mechanosensitive ion channel [Piscirickettsiaceae bacterium]
MLIDKFNEYSSSPQKTINIFITAIKYMSKEREKHISNIISTLDINHINTSIRKSKGAELETTLLSVMIKPNQKIVINIINSKLVKNKNIFKNYLEKKVIIEQQAHVNWIFGKETMDNLFSNSEGRLIKTNQNNAIITREILPFHINICSKLYNFLKQGFLLKYWQWLGIFLVVIVGIIADKLLVWILAFNVDKWKKQYIVFSGLDSTVLRPLGLMAMALLLWFGLGILELPYTSLVILSISVKLLVSLSGVWSSFSLVDVLHAILMYRAQQTHNKFDDLLIPMVSKSLKVLVVVVGTIFAADNLNINVTNLLAGLGLGGLAFALAAKDLVGNFFGSLTILLDRPFHIGDWIIIGDVEGTVEQVGFRSTRVRTFYNSVITLPNALLTTTKVDNMGARRYRRMKTMLGLIYDTPPEKIDTFCEGIRALIQLHPYMRRDYYQVYFNQYNLASLDILIYVFWETPDWNMELRERHRFLLDILRLAKQLGVEFAYPTQTLHLKQDKMTPPSSPGNLIPQMSEADAMTIRQKKAETILNSTLGKGIKSKFISSS